MATVPIEIVLQDAETPVDPTPTPESGGETNITVPDTGTISDAGSNSGGIGSSIGIILPIVIAVLALGAMVALLIHRQQKRKKANNSNDSTEECNTKISKKEKLATATSGTIAIIAATVLVGNLVIPATKAATSVEPGTAELETEDKITIIATREQDSDTITATVKDTSYATANLDFGYKVTASIAENATTANLYLDGDETSEYYIAPVGDGVLENNTWGYTLEEPSEDTTYLPIPPVDTPATITKGNDMVEDEAVDIYYAIKVDKDMPAGSYIGELEYNISPAVEYMQDFATMTDAEKTATLANMPEGEQYILKDIRDEKPYYISKLADGNVWMTQNLDLDLDSTKTYTSIDTDTASDWVPSVSTIDFTGDYVSGWYYVAGYPTSHPASADPEDLYYYKSNNGYIQYDSLTKCEAAGHNNCQHYHAGNYYKWTAAVASNDTSGINTQYEIAPNSICPAGWRLPKGDSADGYVSNEIYNLLNKYGILGDYVFGPDWFSYADGGFDILTSAPLYMIGSKVISAEGRLGSDSGWGGIWTSTIASAGSGVQFNAAYSLVIEEEHVRPQLQLFRTSGTSIRCLVK